uniref:Benzyl alcohol O-benzoyltransferase n=1 Tax=Ananas comosus var. bracteatus TaxID=296719 RepID=A0A6V7NQC6_ANACO|nr:unnamed protein product [Ananas comosus var. bracteatus]
MRRAEPRCSPGGSTPFSYALELVAAAKARSAAVDHLQSVADLMVLKGRPRFATARTYLVSDLTKSGLEELDFGWGKGIYGGPATAMLATFHIPVRSAGGERGILVPVRLPEFAMERFVVEMKRGLVMKEEEESRGYGGQQYATCSLTYNARRSEAVLVAPEKPTPYELKPLSDIDDQCGLRFYRSGVLFLPQQPCPIRSRPGRSHKAVPRRGPRLLLPLAGRLRAGPDDKLIVECTGEGAVFVEAEADVRLEDFDGELSPPIPCNDQLLCEPESASSSVIGRPWSTFR